MRVDARRRDRPVEPSHDARHLTFRRGRVAGDDRLAAPRGIGAAHEVELAARGAVLVAQHVLGIAGAGQVDLDRGIDRDDIVVLGDDPRVVDIIDRALSIAGLSFRKSYIAFCPMANVKTVLP